MTATPQKIFLLGSCLLAFVMPQLCLAFERGDWRVELLASEKLPHDTDSLEARSKGVDNNAKNLEPAVAKLGAITYAERQQAQSEILLMGRAVLPELRSLSLDKKPEVQLRVLEIQRQLEVGGRWSKDELLRLANVGLLHERKNPGVMHPSRRMFVEQFRESAASMKQGYRGMRFVGQESLKGSVADGRLLFSGKFHVEEGDQRLCLDAKTVTGEAVFPKRFRIDVKLGGKAGGEGNYHIGLSVGNVRALIHPGYDTGAFRFQCVDDEKFIVTNRDMGFKPPVDQVMNLSLEVNVLTNGKVKLDVTVRYQQEIFRTSGTMESDVIGKLDCISLDRSGREGGDAFFEDWIVQWDP